MSSILKDLVDQRHAMATRSGGPTVAGNVLRLISIVVIAIAVYRYHSLLFDAAQPYIQQLFNR